jgi:hypothetical protein
MEKTKSLAVADDIAALLRARNPLLWVVTREEGRVERYLFQAAGAAGYVPRTWDVAQGAVDMAGRAESRGSTDPGEMLDTITDMARSGGERTCWIMRDLAPWLTGTIGIATNRKLCNLARMRPSMPRDSAQAVIVLTASSDVPPELAGHVTVVDWPLPDRAEIAACLDRAIEVLPEDMKASAAPNGRRDAAIDAAVGLTEDEAASCYGKSLVQYRAIDPAAVAREKKRVIAREKVLEWFDPLPGGLESVGGLEIAKTWLASRAAAFTPAARAYGLPAPKGAFFVGVSGCGKSMLAKAVSTAWQCPLLRADLGALKSKFVGESEANLRRMFATVEAVGRCVLWFDEVEKSFPSGAAGSADGGVSADALGAVLNWMQERRGEAFIIATANDVESLPPEFLRKGRFDELWFVDVPNDSERSAVLMSALKAHGRDASVFQAPGEIERVRDATAGFTGAEIAAIVPDALYVAYADGARQITADDLVSAARCVVPLTKTAAEKIERLRTWARGRARPASGASAPLSAVEKFRDRMFDIEAA